ncbi:MAG: hypothetical protein FJX77_08880 [Armatimonadetes bacterium]|nr:hypothetical protein [Armatimonadota bacterium]
MKKLPLELLAPYEGYPPFTEEYWHAVDLRGLCNVLYGILQEEECTKADDVEQRADLKQARRYLVIAMGELEIGQEIWVGWDADDRGPYLALLRRESA